MRLGSIALVLGAAACAAAAALLTKSWLAKSEPPPVQIVSQRVEKADVRTVIVAARPLSFGTKLSDRDLRETEWPANSVPEGTFNSRQALITSAGDRVVLYAIAENEPILASKITAPGQRASLSVVIEEGKKAITIRVDDVLGVAGFVQPDDRVDILLTRTGRGPRKDAPGEDSAYTDVLLQDVRVLAIDQLADRKTQATPAKAVTVEVDTADAQKLVLAASIGQLSLALRRAGWSQQMTDPQRISIDDLLKTRRPEAPAADESPVVTVTRATDRTQYQVQEGDSSLYHNESLEPQEVPGASGTDDALQGAEQMPDGDEPPHASQPAAEHTPAAGSEVFGTARADVPQDTEPPQKPE
jgi:pilus assembly protein CpaB